ncbi:MAG: hypothetical protein ACO3P9_07865, partial [Phycisphaerales bacterium]
MVPSAIRRLRQSAPGEFVPGPSSPTSILSLTSLRSRESTLMSAPKTAITPTRSENYAEWYQQV